jgi:hypothetical protein
VVMFSYSTAHFVTARPIGLRPPPDEERPPLPPMTMMYDRTLRDDFLQLHEVGC